MQRTAFRGGQQAEGVVGPPFAKTLIAWQEKQSRDRRDVAHIARASEKDVVEWERGLAVPTKSQFLRLCAAHHAFGACSMPSDEDLAKAQQAEAARRSGSSSNDDFVLPPAAIAAAEAAANAERRKFNRGLTEARLAEKLTMTELADLMSVSRSTISRWETGECVPSSQAYEHLRTLLPNLMNVDSPIEGHIPLFGETETKRVIDAVEAQLASHPHHVMSSADSAALIKRLKVSEKSFNKIIRQPPLSLNSYRAGFGDQGVWYWSRTDFRDDEAIVAVLRKPPTAKVKDLAKPIEDLVKPAEVALLPLSAKESNPLVEANRRAHDIVRAIVDAPTTKVVGATPAPASRALQGAADIAPIRLPFVPTKYDAKRHIPNHAIARFRERYLYGSELNYSTAGCTFLIDLLVEQSIKQGFYEWIQEGTEKLRVVGVPGLQPKQVFLFLVRENQRDDIAYPEVVLTCLPEEATRREQIANGVLINTPFKGLLDEFREIQKMVPTRRVADLTVTVGSVPTENEVKEANSHMRVLPPTPTTHAVASLTVRPRILVSEPMTSKLAAKPAEPLSDDPAEVGLMLGKAIQQLRELRNDLNEAKKLLDEKEAAVDRATTRVKALQEHLMSLS